MKKTLLVILPLCLLKASYASETISTIDKYIGETENGKECRLEMKKHEDSEMVTGKLYVKGKLKIKIKNNIVNDKLEKVGRHNLECADNGSFCFFPFETADKILALNYEGARDISSVSYMKKSMKWRYGERSSQGNYVTTTKYKCKNLKKISASN